jgi:hypothetical protein
MEYHCSYTIGALRASKELALCLPSMLLPPPPRLHLARGRAHDWGWAAVKISLEIGMAEERGREERKGSCGVKRRKKKEEREKGKEKTKEGRK